MTSFSYLLLVQYFHGIEVFRLLVLYQHDAPKGPRPQCSYSVEVVQGQRALQHRKPYQVQFMFYSCLAIIIVIIVSTLGFISSCLDFTKAVKIAAMPDTLKHKIVASAVKSYFGIYCNRNAAAFDAP